MATLDHTEEPRPSVARAIQRQYPGVRVAACARRYQNGCEGMTVLFKADAATLIKYGLAVPGKPARGAMPARLCVSSAIGTRGAGADYGDATSYVVHQMYDSDPPVAKGRQFPPKWTETEFKRIWRRISRSRVQS